MRVQIFLVVKKLMTSSEQAQIFASKIGLLDIISCRTRVLINTIGSTTRLEMNKKNGVTKVKFLVIDIKFMLISSFI